MKNHPVSRVWGLLLAALLAVLLVLPTGTALGKSGTATQAALWSSRLVGDRHRRIVGPAG